MTEPVHYVAGFLFDYDRSNVLLVRKNRPKWQAGKHNGIGGHVEKGETHYKAMVREFQEEAGLYFGGWKEIVTINYSAKQEQESGRSGKAACVSYWYGDEANDEFQNYTSPTDEEIVSMPLSVTLGRIFKVEFVPQVPWLLLLALDRQTPKPLIGGGGMEEGEYDGP